jgi:hypothetical protein
MAGKGGYQKPRNPAPVSGPGKLSRRTDGGPQAIANIGAGGKYGERKAMQEMQAAAPMAGNPAPVAPMQVPTKQTPVTGLFEPTQRPGEPVTAGLSVGPGRTPVDQPTGKYDMVNKYMSQLDTMAAQPDAPPVFKAFVNFIKAASAE